MTSNQKSCNILKQTYWSSIIWYRDFVFCKICIVLLRRIVQWFEAWVHGAISPWSVERFVGSVNQWGWISSQNENCFKYSTAKFSLTTKPFQRVNLCECELQSLNSSMVIIWIHQIIWLLMETVAKMKAYVTSKYATQQMINHITWMVQQHSTDNSPFNKWFKFQLNFDSTLKNESTLNTWFHFHQLLIQISTNASTFNKWYNIEQMIQHSTNNST